MKVFTGNYDDNSIVRNTFKPYMTARYVRVFPQEYEGQKAMRVEFYACKDGQFLNYISS